jgi:hypothetical protein
VPTAGEVEESTGATLLVGEFVTADVAFDEAGDGEVPPALAAETLQISVCPVSLGTGV